MDNHAKQTLHLKPLTTFQVADHCFVSHRTVQQWIADGKLKAYRTPGNHSRVKIKDLLDFLRQHGMPIPNEFERQRKGKKRILIVDDDENLTILLKDLFMIDGAFEVQTASDGFEAGKKFLEFKPDAVILDIRMPKADGFAVCSQIRSDSSHNHVKIVAVSGAVHNGEDKKIIALGADCFLPKPFDNKQLLDHVKNLLGEAYG